MHLFFRKPKPTVDTQNVTSNVAPPTTQVTISKPPLSQDPFFLFGAGKTISEEVKHGVTETCVIESIPNDQGAPDESEPVDVGSSSGAREKTPNASNASDTFEVFKHRANLANGPSQINVHDQISESAAEANEPDIWAHVSFVVFDTETSGIRKHDVVVQMCFLCFSSTRNLLFTYNQYWKLPEGVRIDPRAAAVHKITATKLATEGLDAKVELKIIHDMFAQCKRHGIKMVAHNASFDCRMLKQTADAFGVFWQWSVDDFFCTQRAARGKVQVFDVRGFVKAPSNVELYHHFHEKMIEGDLHDAKTDCLVTSWGYFGGRRCGWWT